MTPGSRVRFTHGPIGLLEHEDAHKFAEPVAQAGDFGTYVREHPLLEGWHIVAVEMDSGRFYAPVDRRQIEVEA